MMYGGSLAHYYSLDTSTPPVGIFSLPPELLGEIFEYLATFASPHDIFNLRCVNETFCDLATPIAFWETVVHTTDKSTQGFLELLLRPEVAEYVRDIKIVEDPGECRAVSLC
jgi:hypothetical protein